MRSAEVSAATREEAIQQALEELGIDMSDAAQIEILDEGSKGLFGLGARNVRVRVTTEVGGSGNGGKRDKQPTLAKGRRGGRSKGEGQGSQQRQGQKQEAKPAENRSRDREESRANRGERPQREERPRREEGPPREKAEARPPRERKESKAQDVEGEEEREPIDVKALERHGKTAASILKEIIDKMGIENTVESSVDEEGNIVLSVDSDTSAILIGRKGRNLSAMQYLINRIMNRETEDDFDERIIVDVEGYLERRRESLEEMALDLAERAKRTGRNVRVKPLSAQERRVVHMALQDDPDVRTYSVGNSSMRNVIIAPKDGQENQGRGRRGRGRGRRPDNRGKPEGYSNYLDDGDDDDRRTGARY